MSVASCGAGGWWRKVETDSVTMYVVNPGNGGERKPPRGKGGVGKKTDFGGQGVTVVSTVGDWKT